MRASLVNPLSQWPNHVCPNGGGHNQTISATSATVGPCMKLLQLSPFLSQFDKPHRWRGLVHSPRSICFIFLHNLERETSKLLSNPVKTLTLTGLGLFELQRDYSLLLLPHRHFVWIVISYRPLFSFPDFSPLSHHISLSCFLRSSLKTLQPTPAHGR